VKYCAVIFRAGTRGSRMVSVLYPDTSSKTLDRERVYFTLVDDPLWATVASSRWVLFSFFLEFHLAWSLRPYELDVG
jgi:hypothetical protein